MKKIPSLFVRVFQDHKTVECTREVTPGCEWVLNGEGIATRKYDGACCLVKDKQIYARFDAKQGKKAPVGAIPCQEKADEVTGHFPHWVLVTDQPSYKWYKEALKNTLELSDVLEDGTYEVCGPHFQKNAEHVGERDILIKHGSLVLTNVPRNYDGLRKYLDEHYMEGIVFHRGNGDMCKIKRVDFGFEWNNSTKKQKE